MYSRVSRSMLRKQLLTERPVAPNPQPEELDIAALATVFMTSEAADHPIENVFDTQRLPPGPRRVSNTFSIGWSAASEVIKTVARAAISSSSGWGFGATGRSVRSCFRSILRDTLEYIIRPSHQHKCLAAPQDKSSLTE